MPLQFGIGKGAYPNGTDLRKVLPKEPPKAPNAGGL